MFVSAPKTPENEELRRRDGVPPAPSAVDVGVIVDHSQESVSTALLRKFCPLRGPGHGRGPDDRFPMSATRMLVMSSAGRFRMQTSSDIPSRLRDLDSELWR